MLTIIIAIVFGAGLGIGLFLFVESLSTKLMDSKGLKPKSLATEVATPVAPSYSFGWLSGFGVKVGDIAKIERVVAAVNAPILIAEIPPGLIKTLKQLQSDGKITGIEASQFIAGTAPLDLGHVLILVTHRTLNVLDRAFVVRANKLPAIA